MSSFTVSFTGNSSVLRADFFPEINLDPNANYSCALLDFTTYNSIPNIIEGVNNELKFKCTTEQKVKNKNGKFETKREIKEGTISLPTGTYEADDIVKYLKSKLDE